MAKLPETSVANVPQLEERSDGLWNFTGAETLEECAAVFLKVDGGVDSSRWAMAAIAASASEESKYGEKSIEKMAELVGRKPRTVWTMARTYKTVTEKCIYRQNLDLSYSHYVAAVRYKEDPAYALAIAKEQNLSSLGLADWVSEQNASPETKPQKKKRASEWREFLERVQGIIEDDFMATCPKADWGRRVFEGWLDELRWELDGLERTETAERIAEAVADGRQTISDIKQATGLPTKEIEIAAAAKVATGEWCWAPEGRRTDDQRGETKRKLNVCEFDCMKSGRTCVFVKRNGHENNHIEAAAVGAGRNDD